MIKRIDFSLGKQNYKKICFSLYVVDNETNNEDNSKTGLQFYKFDYGSKASFHYRKYW
jgi:hypothetical protein